jgi:hypothetical protein
MGNNDDLDEVFSRVNSDGIASVKVRDGHVFVITLDKLRELVKVGEAANKDRIVLFIQDPHSIN